MLKRLVALSLAVGASLTGAADAQEHNLPAMNALGRFFGVGWSNGYHSGTYDGRFQTVKNNHPASMYRSNALLYPYQPGYEPFRPFTQANQGYAQPVHSNIGNSQSNGSNLNNMPNQVLPGSPQLAPTPAPIVPPKPIEPPPTWLRPFLKDGTKVGNEHLKPSNPEEVEAEQASPSDLLKPKASPAKPAKDEPTDSSDEDDLLTLTPPKTPRQHYNEARRNQGSNR